MDFFNLIKKKGYISLSFDLCNKIGLKPTVVLTYLIQKYLYFNQKFYCKDKEIESKLNLSSSEVENIIKLLCNYGFINLQENRYFIINEDKIIECFNCKDIIFAETEVKDKNLLSDSTLNLFFELYNKSMPILTQKKMLNIIENENLIKKAIEISAEYSPEHSSYIFKIL
ncbi:MAG: hypothetical protein ACOCP8_09735, partial [archaeon]